MQQFSALESNKKIYDLCNSDDEFQYKLGFAPANKIKLLEP
jgi:hypothetical protein